MRINRKTELKSSIPTASLPDIVFIMLFFFLVTTVLRNYTGLDVQLPDADKEVIEKIESRRHIAYIWIDINENVSFNDIPVSIKDESLYNTVYDYAAIQKDPLLRMLLQYDQNLKMEIVAQANNQLRKANALNVYFSTVSKNK